MEVITVIELLSPSNKRANGDGRREYLQKRDEIISSQSHLVEIDLLRGGERLPIIEPLPPADFHCFVCRADKRPQASRFSWTMRQVLPTIPIPLMRGDADVMLPLQLVFSTVYDRAGYDLSLDYSAELKPVPDEETAAWIQQLVPDGAH